MEWLRRALLSLCVMVLAACSGGTPSPSPSAPGGAGEVLSWTRPPDPMGLAQQAGLTPDAREYVDFHQHARLDVFVNGSPQKVPGGIGIETTDPAVQKFSEDNFAGIPESGCAQACISPLHTHDRDGVIHIEARSQAAFTLGQFFEELAVRLDATCVDDYCSPATPIAVYVNGQAQSGNPADIVLADLQEIAIVIGTPPAVIPSSFSGEQ